MSTTESTNVLVIGSGIAGCAAALSAARNGDNVALVTKATHADETSTGWAQGGIATTRHDADQFKQDIIDASDNTADPNAVDILVNEAPSVIEDVLIETLDVPFDKENDEFAYGQEAAHSTRRILHVGASTGKHILRPFFEYLQNHQSVRIYDDSTALELITEHDTVHGAIVEDSNTSRVIFAGNTILATGGIGTLYPYSTNPSAATGDGIGMASLAGAQTADMAFVQFHPTAYAADDPDELFLISEAVRGEGAVLRNGNDVRFMPDYHVDAELAPRDVVARAVSSERSQTGTVYLDVSSFDFESTFPDLAAKCEQHDVDIDAGIPVAPAQHFLCGGVVVDTHGRTTVDGLYAVGECARTGVHGANRLASTGLLEGLVWGVRAGNDAAGKSATAVETPDVTTIDPQLPDQFTDAKFKRIQQIMGRSAGITRTRDDLQNAQAELRRIKGEIDAYARTRTSRSLYELRNAAVTALLITQAASETDSVGCHQLVESADPAPQM